MATAIETAWSVATVIRAAPTRGTLGAAVALAGLTVLLEVPYPLVSGRVRDRLTIAAVLTFCAASTAHAVATRGARWAATLVAVAAGAGLLAESVGTHTGIPFGAYSYDGGLGPRLLDVPLVIPLAWAMMAYPALLIGRGIASSGLGRAIAGGVALASWDLFLDPQMVRAGHWRWSDTTPHLPGVPSVPLTNYLGWLVVAVLLMAVLNSVLNSVLSDVPAAVPADDRVPLGLYLWTFGSSVLANLTFFGRPNVALWGGLVMGAVLVALWRSR